ncbi:MAG TPA: S1 RNA-binding domain-containing protein [Anaerolineae bacterium]|nr:S1 RNA-binding domain-containing protein [Anaerolineae bacterium]
MSNEEESSFLDELLEHDYEQPRVGDIRKGVIVAKTPQGIIVDLGTKRDGIVPTTDLNKLSPEERDALQVNDEVPVYITEADAPDSLVVSIHLAQLNQDWIDAEALMESGEIMEGEVIGYNKGGAIVPFGRLRGFIPASHLSGLTRGLSDRQRQQKLAKLRGEKLPLKVIEVDRRRRRLVFSQRDAQKEWEEIRKQELLESLHEGDILTGRISGLRDFGIFVDLGGADGLVHISELAWHRIDHPREVVKVGEEIEVYVLSIDKKEHRISLSRKRLLENPWSRVEEKYSQNELVEGKITRIVDYGAFAELEPGIEGLLHVSQLARVQVNDPHEVLNVGETHLLRVVSIDPKRQRIGLSLRAVSPQEQIEWMAQHSLEEEIVAAEEEAVVEEMVEEVAEVEAAAKAIEEGIVEEATAEMAEVEETAVALEADIVEEAVAKVVETEAAAEAIEDEIAEEALEEIVAVEVTAEAVEETILEEAVEEMTAVEEAATIAEEEIIEEAATEIAELEAVADVILENAAAEAATVEEAAAEVEAEIAVEAAIEMTEVDAAATAVEEAIADEALAEMVAVEEVAADVEAAIIEEAALDVEVVEETADALEEAILEEAAEEMTAVEDVAAATEEEIIEEAAVKITEMETEEEAG